MKNNVNLNECYCSGIKPAIAYNYEFLINENSYTVSNKTITGEELHELNQSSLDTHFIRMKTHNGKELVGPSTVIDLTKCGIERFIIQSYSQEKLDLNECFCEGATPIITYKYLIKINREKYEVENEVITGAEILKLVKKDPQTHRLRMFAKNGKVIIQPSEKIDLTKCGVERFVIEPLDCTEGFISSKNFDHLLPEDNIFLENLENQVDLLHERNLNWLILRDYPIPEGYKVVKSDVAILIPNNYPAGRLDMAYYYPALIRKDDKHIGALSNQNIEGKVYQRWSRHRTSTNPWNAELDNLESHLDLMLNCLKAEFKKR